MIDILALLFITLQSEHTHAFLGVCRNVLDLGSVQPIQNVTVQFQGPHHIKAQILRRSMKGKMLCLPFLRHAHGRDGH